MVQVPLLRLKCGVNSYSWGKKGNDSVAARFAAASPAHGLIIQPEQRYSELWMGTHPSNPSSDVTTGRSLLSLIQDNQALISDRTVAKYGVNLPFLFKVLSVDQALSIQAHPNKALAKQLRARDPTNYPDDNHKPEMAIAITPFEALCGFRPLTEIAHFIETVSPLRALVGDSVAAAFAHHVRLIAPPQAGGLEADSHVKENDAADKQALRTVFAALLSSTESAIKAETIKLMAAAQSDPAAFAGGGVGPTSGPTMAELVTRLYRDFGADIGIFILFFLNLLKLEPGEALFLGANDVHAYLSGDVVECMASSDNVVRAGLTPKRRDVETLVSMLTYKSAPAEAQKLTRIPYAYATVNRKAYDAGSSLYLYPPPPTIDEYAIIRAELCGGSGARATFEPLDGPSILICIQGSGLITVGGKDEVVQTGDVFFIGATAEVVLEAKGDTTEESFIMFRAFCEVAG